VVPAAAPLRYGCEVRAADQADPGSGRQGKRDGAAAAAAVDWTGTRGRPGDH